MGSGDKSLWSFHIHIPHIHNHHNHHHHHHHHHHHVRNVPKGCLAVKVGQGEFQERFVVPVIYFNHPLFMQLLKEAEDEYGFNQKGTIAIPCRIEEFRHVQGLIDRERSIGHNHHHHHNHNLLVGCFRV